MRRIVIREAMRDANGVPVARRLVLRVLVPGALQPTFADAGKASLTPDVTTSAELAALQAGQFVERMISIDLPGKSITDLKVEALRRLASAQAEMSVAGGGDALTNVTYDDSTQTWSA